MNKKTTLYVLIALVFLAVFNTMFFLIGGTDHPASVWISYGFIHFSYLMVAATPIFVKKNSAASVLGFSLYSVSSAYFAIEFIVGLILILIASDSYKATLIIQIVIAGIYAVVFFSNLLANEHTSENIQRHDAEVIYIKDSASRIKLLIGKSSDRMVNKELERAYDLMHSSPARSHESVALLELDIKNVISELECEFANGNVDRILQLIKRIISTTEERNRRLRML